MDGFIYDDDENDVEENDVHFYRQFHQEFILSNDDDIDDDEIYFNNDDNDDEINEIILMIDKTEPQETKRTYHRKIRPKR